MARDIPADRTEVAFEDFKPPYTPQQAETEAHRCLSCADAPCMKACPTRIDIPGFIRKIATGNLWGSARTIFEANILGMSCARVCPVEVLCAGGCVYNALGEPPIQIGRLQRYATDTALAKGWRYFEAGPDTGRSVGLVGAGPASLACAHELRRRGHACTIYEKREVVGGLNTTGVAPYKMRADRSLEEVRWVLGIGGIEVVTGVEVGRDVTLEALRARHDALFLGLGLGADRLLPRPPEGLAGVHGAVEFIERVKLGRVELAGVERAVVVGGGNTALDAVRALRQLGVPSVALVYRGGAEEMSGYAHEWEAARVEGVDARWRTLPVGYVGEGQVRGLECIRLDAQRQPVPGSGHVVEADLVLLAIGQERLAALLSGLEGVRVEGGVVVVDAQGATGRAGVFAGGDCANGGKEVVNAVAEGKRAAEAIDAWLKGGS